MQSPPRHVAPAVSATATPSVQSESVAQPVVTSWQTLAVVSHVLTRGAPVRVCVAQPPNWLAWFRLQASVYVHSLAVHDHVLGPQLQ